MRSSSSSTSKTRWLVDGANLMGSVPDGWWKNPEKATRRWIEDLDAYARATGEDVTVVFDRRVPDVPPGRHGAITVLYASRHGPNAADDEIVRLVAADEDPASLRVVTSDRRLAERVRELGAPVNSTGNFRARLEQVALARTARPRGPASPTRSRDN
jgi:predicted RNA-binding protein with PIN domain